MAPLLAESNPLLTASPGLMIWTLITFAIAMTIMYKLAFKRIQDAIDARRKAIAESVEQAERTKSEAAQLLDEYKQQLASARAESEAIVDRARKAGDEMTTRIKAEGEEQRREQIAQTQSQVQAEVERAMSDLRRSVADMTMTAAEKVLRGALDSSAHQKLVEQAVEELDFSRLQKVGASS